MIKLIAKNDLGFTCRICKRIVRNEEQFLQDSGKGTIRSYHVRCIMELCGKEVDSGMVWKTAEEVELDVWLAKMKQAKDEGRSLLDA